MKTKLKQGDIVEIIDIHESDSYFANKLIGKRGIIKEVDFYPCEIGYEGHSIFIDGLYYSFYAVKVKKVRTLTPKTKKK